MIAQLYSIVAVGLIAGSIVQAVRECLSIRRWPWLPLGAVALSFLPAAGLTLGRWGFSFTGIISLPLSLILVWYVCVPVLGSAAIELRTLRCYWLATITLGLLYFPAALGWSSIDPHAWGWNDEFVFIPVVIAAIFVWLNQPILSFMAIAAAMAWKLELLDSSNGWNYLIDPIAIGISLVSLIADQIQRITANRQSRTVLEIVAQADDVAQKIDSATLSDGAGKNDAARQHEGISQGTAAKLEEGSEQRDASRAA